MTLWQSYFILIFKKCLPNTEQVRLLVSNKWLFVLILNMSSLSRAIAFPAVMFFFFIPLNKRATESLRLEKTSKAIRRPHLGYFVQPWNPSTNSRRGQRDTQRAGTPLLRGQTETWGCSVQREKGLQRPSKRSLWHLSVTKGNWQETWTGAFIRSCSDSTRGNKLRGEV